MVLKIILNLFQPARSQQQCALKDRTGGSTGTASSGRWVAVNRDYAAPVPPLSCRAPDAAVAVTARFQRRRYRSEHRWSRRQKAPPASRLLANDPHLRLGLPTRRPHPAMLRSPARAPHRRLPLSLSVMHHASPGGYTTGRPDAYLSASSPGTA